MAADAGLIARLDTLVGYFNARSMDLPDGLFDRKTQFLLNGVAFEALLGRSPDDPLVLMLARGPAGYRFVAKAVQHALDGARLERGAFDGDAAAVSGQCWLSGRLRDTGAPFECVFDVDVALATGGPVTSMTVRIDADPLAALDAARKS